MTASMSTEFTAAPAIPLSGLVATQLVRAGRRTGPRRPPPSASSRVRRPQVRGVTVRVVVAQPDGARLAQLLDATASGPGARRRTLDQVAAVHHAVAKGQRTRKVCPQP